MITQCADLVIEPLAINHFNNSWVLGEIQMKKKNLKFKFNFEELDNNSVSKVLSKYAKKAKTPTKKKGLKSKIKKVVPTPVKKVLKKAVRKK